jgi:hypothetical protein
VSVNTCRGCRAAIEWVETTEKKRMPVDPARVLVVPEQGAKLRMVTDDGRVIAARLVRAGEQEQGVPARAPHWSSCTKPEQFRRGKRATA